MKMCFHDHRNRFADRNLDFDLVHCEVSQETKIFIDSSTPAGMVSNLRESVTITLVYFSRVVSYCCSASRNRSFHSFPFLWYPLLTPKKMLAEEGISHRPKELGGCIKIKPPPYLLDIQRWLQVVVLVQSNFQKGNAFDIFSRGRWENGPGKGLPAKLVSSF